MMLVTGVGVHVEVWGVGEVMGEVEALDADVTNVEDCAVSGMEDDRGMIVVVIILGGSAEDAVVVVTEESSAEGEAVTVSNTVTKLVPAEMLCTDIIVKMIEPRGLESDNEKRLDDEEGVNVEGDIEEDVETGAEVGREEVGEGIEGDKTGGGVGR
jgi:hypothetical protein